MCGEYGLGALGNARRPERRSNMLRDSTPTAITLNGQAADDRRVAAVYRCRLQLDQITATDDPDIKFCEQCKQKVFKVIDFDGFENAVAAKACVWGLRAPGGAAPDRYFVGSADAIYEVTPVALERDK